ncbi:hypothetical protein MMC34_007427 [Xylographa carneopallida]|nr:hypothetical protein [Xylographa carneopallida]
MKAFGITPLSVEKVFADPRGLIHGEERSKSLLINDNPSNKAYMNLERDWFKIQLLAPDRLQELQSKYTHFLEESLAWDNLSHIYIMPSDPGVVSKTMSLKGFTRHTVSHCSTSTFFGRKLLEVAPSFAQDYQNFEEESWKIFYRLPPFLVRKSHRAKAKAIDGLVQYLSLPEEERSELAWIFRTMNIELRYLSLPTRDVAGIIMIIIWAINNNAHKIAFWIFAHLLHDLPFLAAVRCETDAAFSTSGVLDMERLLNACPHLDAIWHEALRFYNAASAVREALSPCIIGGKSIRPGDMLVAPFRQFHLNEGIFGADAPHFRPHRFLENKTLPRTKGYAPFGGGHTYCPGRLFAQREIYMFVAVTLWRFELELVPRKRGQRMPEVDRNVPSAAAMGPAEDVQVRMRPRVHKQEGL